MAGDRWAAFDRLPPSVRSALAFAGQDWCVLKTERSFGAVLRAGTAAGVAPDELARLYIDELHRSEEGEVLIHSEHCRRAYGIPAAHVAAAASILRELPLPSRSRARGQASHRWS